MLYAEESIWISLKWDKLEGASDPQVYYSVRIVTELPFSGQRDVTSGSFVRVKEVRAWTSCTINSSLHRDP